MLKTFYHELLAIVITFLRAIHQKRPFFTGHSSYSFSRHLNGATSGKIYTTNDMNSYIGQKVEQYKIEAKIGTGSSGTVYRATDLNLKRPVVLKLLKPTLTKSPARQQQILKAAQSASRLSHPAIVPLYNFGRQNGHLYLVTAHVAGISLERLLALLAHGKRILRLDESLHIIAHIADGLGYAHQAGVLHGDLKPGNILIKPLQRPLRSGDPTLKAMLADFGLSPIPNSGIPANHSAEKARILRRYLPYLAPERLAGQPADGRADIYSLGIILHQLVAGTQFAPLPNKRQPLRELCPGVPTAIADIVAKATAYELADRYQLAEQMGDDLRLISIERWRHCDQTTGRAIVAGFGRDAHDHLKIICAGAPEDRNFSRHRGLYRHCQVQLFVQ